MRDFPQIGKQKNSPIYALRNGDPWRIHPFPPSLSKGYIPAFKMSQGVEKEIIFPVEMSSFLFPAWCIEGDRGISGIVGCYVHSGKGNGMTLLCDTTNEDPTFSLFWSAIGTV